MSQYKVYLDSTHFACKSNGINTSKVFRYLKSNGHEVIHNKKEADYVIIVTCGFHEKWVIYTIQVIEELLEKCKPEMKIITIGCLNKINPSVLEKYQERLIILDKSFNNDHSENHDKVYTKGMDCERLDSIFMNSVCFKDVKGEFLNEKIITDCGILGHHDSEKNPFDKLGEKMYQLIKNKPFSKKILDEVLQRDRIFIEISRGCVGHCSFCVIKKARGNVVSREIDDILDDIQNYYEEGKALFLVSDDCASYGVDIKTSFPTLLNAINKKFPNIPIDINYINPLFIMKNEKEYLKAFIDTNIRYIHLSMQSGSNRMVKIMNRHYAVIRIKEFIKKIRKISPHTLITTSLIVGHPKENTIDFLETLNLIKYFDACIVFPYSDRKGTKSAEMDGHNSGFVVNLKGAIAGNYAVLRVFFSVILDVAGLGKSKLYFDNKIIKDSQARVSGKMSERTTPLQLKKR